MEDFKRFNEEFKQVQDKTDIYIPTYPQPVLQQPFIQQNSFVIGRKPRRSWTIDLCGCFKNCEATLCSLFCFPCYLCMSYSKAEENCWSCLLGGLTHLRTKVRTERGIQGSICADVCVSTLIPCCTLVQLAHEIEKTEPLF